MEDHSVELTIVPISTTSLPSEEAILAAGESFLKDFPTGWKAGKTYGEKVKTYSKGTWHARVSVHPPSEATFDQLWAGIGKDKAINEKEFVPAIHRVQNIKELSPAQSIWSMFYEFTPPVSPRVFTVLQVTHLSERTGTIVSIPVDHPDAKAEEKDTGSVRGRYVSVERIKELEDGQTEWLMATWSTPGGQIPKFLAEATVNGKIAEDVPHFLKWLRSKQEFTRLSGWE